MRTLHQAEPCARPDCRHMRYQLAESVPMVEWEAWRDVAIALISEIAVELLDPASMAMDILAMIERGDFDEK